MEHYGKKARFFIYNSSNLNQLDNFSSSSGINVMIINTQAFAFLTLKEDGKKQREARIIYSSGTNSAPAARSMSLRQTDQLLFWMSRRRWAAM